MIDTAVLDKHIVQLVDETESFEDAMTYIADIIYDYEIETGQVVCKIEMHKYIEAKLNKLIYNIG